MPYLTHKRIRIARKVCQLVCFLLVSIGCSTTNGTSSDYPKKDDTIEKGHVCFTFTVMPDGSVKNPLVYESVPKGYFDAEATRVLLTWKFKPEQKDGVAVEASGKKYCLDFALDEDPQSGT